MKVIKPNGFRDSPIKFEIPEDEGKRKLNLNRNKQCRNRCTRRSSPPTADFSGH